MKSETLMRLFVEYADPGLLREGDVNDRLARQNARLESLRGRPEVEDARPVFTRSPEELLEEQLATQAADAPPLPDLTRWIRIRTTDAAAGAALRTEIYGQDDVVRAFHPTYLGEVARWRQISRNAWVAGKRLSASLSWGRDPHGSAAGADQSMNQRYLLSAPWGVGVVDVPGWPEVNGIQPDPEGAAGDPSRIRIGVIDDYWNKHHPDFGHLSDFADETGWFAHVDDHGTNVIGILFSAKNRHGLLGMAVGAQLVFAYPYVRDDARNIFYSVADAISRATARLRPGDVLLIERQIEGRAVELSQICHDAIRHAVAKGVVVVEPAGNSGHDLDKLENLEQPEGGEFVDIARHDSGAIMVGAGLEASPQRPLRHRANANRCYGSRVDVQSYGLNVLTTTGTGRLGKAVRSVVGVARMPGADDTYTAGFNGTSSASAIVAGAMVVACSVAKALDPGDVPLAPATLRELLIRTGSPQSPLDAATEHIGPQPDVPTLLREIRHVLYARHRVPEPEGAKPELEQDELRLLHLVASGLSDAEVAALMKLELPEAQATWQRTSDKLVSETLVKDKRVPEKHGAPRALAMARAGDHWGLL